MRANGRSSFCARQQSRLAQRPGQKIVHQRQLADLGVQRLHVDRGLGRLAMAFRSENPCRPFQQLAAPRRDLVRVNVKLLRQLGQRPLALNGSQCHLGLEGRAVVPACSLRHMISCSAAMLTAFRQKLHLAVCPDLLSHLSAPCKDDIRVSHSRLSLRAGVARGSSDSRSPRASR